MVKLVIYLWALSLLATASLPFVFLVSRFPTAVRLAQRLFLAVLAFCTGFLLLVLTQPAETFPVVNARYFSEGTVVFVGPGTGPEFVGLATTILVALALAVGLVLKVPPLWRLWSGEKRWAVLLTSLSISLLVGNPEVSWPYFGLLFAIANWPLRERQRVRKPDPDEYLLPEPHLPAG